MTDDTADDPLSDFQQPRCPEDGIVMRTTPTAFVCPNCGYEIPIEQVAMPEEFTGPDISEKRRR